MYRWEKDTRYYQVVVCKDLLGDWTVTKVWGRKGSAMGQIRREVFESEHAASSKIKQIAKTRAQHGYRQIFTR